MTFHSPISRSILTEIPKRPMGKPARGSEEIYQTKLKAWADEILKLDTRIDFGVSSRGWCYILEEWASLSKNDFGTAESKITECRKAGYLPLGICVEDKRRLADGLEDIDDLDVADYATSVFRGVDRAHKFYTPISFWDDKKYYIEMVVEKIDLKGLFDPVCRRFRIPIKNSVGWSDINSQAKMMKRFAWHAGEGRQCVLLYCGDFDPAGLQISTHIRSNLKELTGAVNGELKAEGVPDWDPETLIIDRFGLTYDSINEARLSWIPNLATSSSGHPLDDIRHKHHFFDYVQNYLKSYCPNWRSPLTPFTHSPGARKCEANTLVVRPRLARKLCLRTILKYLSPRDPQRYRSKLKEPREELRKEIMTYGWKRATRDRAGRYLIRSEPNSNRVWS